MFLVVIMALLTSGGFEEVWRRHRAELEGRISGKIADSAIETSSYSTNAGNFEIEPLAVIAPEGVDDVVETLQFCRRYAIPVTPRGAGTSVTDAALGHGIVLDFSRNMNSILALDIANGLVTAGAGITIEALNLELKKYGKMVPIFPVKGWKCTVGGCISNDAGGFLSTGFGRMHDTVVAIETVNAEGRRLELKRGAGEIQHPDIDILKSKLLPLLKEPAAPFRGTCGYRISSLKQDSVDFVDLMIGSEGSLSIFTSATMRIVDRLDTARSVLIGFGTAKDAFRFAAAAGEDAVCLEYIDQTLASAFRSVHQGFTIPRNVMHWLLAIFKSGSLSKEYLAGRGAAEIIDVGGSPEEVMRCLKDAIHRLQRPSPSGRYVVAAEGVEVPPAKMPDLMIAVEEISRRYALRSLVFGHAAEGIMYIRPFLNLRKSDDREKFASFMTELATALKAEGGRISSENGIGLQLLPYVRYAMDERLTTAFELLKKSFDPLNILGGQRQPDNEEEQPYRFGPEHERRPFRPRLNWNTPDVISRFDERPLSMIDEIEACHGCGECRTLSFIETQCPVYKTTGSELTSPRGLNNLVRLLSNMGGVPTIAMYSGEYARSIYDYCIECKMCAAECPSHVNTPKIMIEARAQHVKRTGAGTVGRTSRFFSDYELYTMIASSVARLSNRLIKSRNARSALEHAFGIDRRRKIPEFDLEPFSEWFEKHVSRPGKKGEVAYFSDMYANYFDSRIGRAVVGILEEAGYATLFPKQHFTGLPLIYLGMLREAGKYVLENVSYLYPFAVRGTPVVCSSPSAVMALRNDYLSVVDDERSRTVARRVVDVHEFLLDVIREEETGLDFQPVARRILYHPSCHSRALGTDRKVVELLNMIPGAEIEEIHAGCCGAGGSYGFAKETFNLSMEIGKKVFVEAGREMDAGTVLVTDGEECALQIEQATGRAPEMTLLLLARSAGLQLSRVTVAGKNS